MIMDFPPFLSSLIIASSATSALLFGILTYVHKQYNSRTLESILFGSLVFTIFTNALLIIAFYQTSDLSNNQIYPLLSYLIGMFLLIVASIFVFLNKIAKTM